MATKKRWCGREDWAFVTEEVGAVRKVDGAQLDFFFFFVNDGRSLS